MSEGQRAETTWKNVKTDVFEAFTEFAYNGNYAVPVMILLKERDTRDDEPSYVPDQEPPADDWGFQPSRKKKSRPPESPAFQPFEYRFIYPIKPLSRFSARCDPSLEWGASDNVYDSLLLHASLYVLADMWGVDDLVSLSLFKLHKSLSMLQSQRKPVPDIVSLIRYAYSDERTADREPLDLLRELLCHFVADHAREMSKDKSFLVLLEEGGAFARDVWNTKIAST